MEIDQSREGLVQPYQEIVVHRNRQRAIPSIIFHTIFVLCFLAVTAISVWLGSRLPLYQLMRDVNGLILLIWGMFLCSWSLALLSYMRVTLHLYTRWLLARDPVLIINHQGIQIGKLPFVIGETFLFWEEIDAISFWHVFVQTGLCIRPKHPKQYFSRFGFWKRLFIRNASWPIGPIIVYQSWMVQPIDELLQQIRSQYTRELHEYGIQLQI